MNGGHVYWISPLQGLVRRDVLGIGLHPILKDLGPFGAGMDNEYCRFVK